MKTRFTVVSWSFAVLILVSFCYSEASAETYEERKAALWASVAKPFAEDGCTHETDLDQEDYQKLLKLEGPKLIDNTSGWSVEARTGGRPFLCFDEIVIDGTLWSFDRTGFLLKDSGIPQSELDAHFDSGKTVNRFWFTHTASTGWPIVVVFTPDGFFNVAGAKAPKLQGAAARFGFIGEPFGDGTDYAQHVDNVEIEEVNNVKIKIRYDVHSEAGEGTVEATLVWDAVKEQPSVEFKSAHIPRLNGRLGFAGLNFMRGPSLSGLKNEYGTPEGGIEAFHDGRSVFLLKPDGSSVRNLLVPAVRTDAVIRDTLLADVPMGARLIMDQPQNAENYFSKTPYPHYENRTDLILQINTTATTPVSVQRAQIPVDLDSVNPEASETVNVFYAVDMITSRMDEFTYTLDVAAEDFEYSLSGHQQGVVFVTDETGAQGSLAFLPLDGNFASSWPERRSLTDRVIRNPHRPSISSDGRFVAFDAARDYESDTKERIHVLDLYRGTVRRITVDPFGGSLDRSASFKNGGAQVSLITNRGGSVLSMNIEDVNTGLGSGAGNEQAKAEYADWSHVRNEIVLVDRNNNLKIFNVSGSTLTETLANGTDLKNPKFSPDGNRVAYAAGSVVYVINRDGSGKARVIADAGHPAWADNSRLIVDRTVNGETDLYLVTVSTGAATPLTPENDGINASEPAFVPASNALSSVIHVSNTDGTCGGNSPCHTTIQAALNEAEAGDESQYTLKVAAGTYAEAFFLKKAKAVALEGGWDQTFTTQQANTTVIRSLGVSKGSVTLRNLVIRP